MYRLNVKQLAKCECEAKHTDRCGANPPPAYTQQCNRRFLPKVQQQAHANLVNLQGVKTQIMQSLIATTDQSSRQFSNNHLHPDRCGW